jgi:HK97 family phage major capsid protein
VKTIATWMSASKQALDDVAGLEQFLRIGLMWANERAVEDELVAGDGTGEHLSGLTLSSDAFDGSILSPGAGYNLADNLAAAGVQLAESGGVASFFIVSPRDWFRLETLKEANRNYIIGSPAQAFREALRNKQVIPTPAMQSGKFLAVDATWAVIRQRQLATMDIPTEHSTFFAKNLVAIRCEERLCLVCAPGVAVYGALASGPA